MLLDQCCYIQRTIGSVDGRDSGQVFPARCRLSVQLPLTGELFLTFTSAKMHVTVWITLKYVHFTDACFISNIVTNTSINVFVLGDGPIPFPFKQAGIRDGNQIHCRSILKLLFESCRRDEMFKQ